MMTPKRTAKQDKPHGESFIVTTICFFIVTSLFYLLIIGIKPGTVDILSAHEIEQIDLSYKAVLLNEQIAEWYPGKLYEPKDFSSSTLVNENEAINANTKYGTYRIQLNIPANRTYGITGQTADYAQKVYVNGLLLSQVGQVSDDKTQFIPKNDFYSVYFTTQTDTTEIIIQYAYHNHEFGFIKDIYLAEQHVIVAKNRAEFLSNGLVLGVLLAFSVYFFGMFISYTERISFLWFAFACFCAALHYSLYFSKDIMTLLPNVSWYILHKAEYVSRISFYLFLTMYVISALKLKVSTWTKCIFFGGFLAIITYYIITPSTVYTKNIFIIGALITVILILQTAYVLLQGFKNKAFKFKENLIVGFSVVLMVISWLVEAFTYQGVSWYVQPYITMLIVFFSAVALTRQFSRTERELALSQIRQREIAQNAAMLERINNMKTDFFHKMAHEIKTPLTIMSGYAQLTNKQIENDEVNSETIQNLKVISSEANRLAYLVSSLMEMPTTPISNAVLNELSVAEYLHYACVVCSGLLKKKDNNFIIKGETEQYILGNMEMLMQMMINLVSNSNRYMENGEFTIEVLKEKDENYVQLLVSDTGCGIPKEYAEKVFEKGFTTNGTKGIGLSICKEIVQLHGGDIVLVNNYKQGAAFKITIPICSSKE